MSTTLPPPTSTSTEDECTTTTNNNNNNNESTTTTMVVIEEPPCPWEESLELTRKQRKLLLLEQQQQQQQLLLQQQAHHTSEPELSSIVEEENSQSIIDLATTTTTTTTTTTNEEVKEEEIIIIDTQKNSSVFRHYVRCYYELWKTRLSSLVVFTTLGGYYASGGKILDWKSTLALTTGTFLQAACANSLNELYEVDRDKIMTRTRNRPLPTGRISKGHALLQAIIAGVGGSYLLYRFNNPLTCALGVANIVIYAGVYTPLKVVHWLNTWIGTVNGSLAPLMGSASVTNNVCDPSGLFLFGVMYLWQISHFMAIGYKCKFDYSRAGYEMLSISNPEHAATQALLHSAALFPMCYALPYYGVLPWWFAALSTPINYYLLLKPSIQFKRQVNYETATALFWRTLGHLPALFTTSVIAFCWQRGLKSWLKKQVVDRTIDGAHSLFLAVTSTSSSAE